MGRRFGNGGGSGELELAAVESEAVGVTGEGVAEGEAVRAELGGAAGRCVIDEGVGAGAKAALLDRFSVTPLPALGGTLAFYALTLEAEAGNVRLLAANFALMGAVILLLAWYREAAERLMFAQREHMRRLNAELARLNAEKNEFMAIASHDLQSPLATVHGLAGQLEAGRAGHPAEAHAVIRALARRMLDLVENYLGAHAAESGALPVRLERVDLRVQAAQAAGRHGPAAAPRDSAWRRRPARRCG